MRNRSTRRRILTAFVLVLLVVGTLVVKLVDVQVVHAESLDAQAAQKRGAVRTLYGPRGDIVSDDGTVLARSVLRYNVSASPSQAKTFTREGKKITRAEAAKEIGSATGQSASAILGILDDALERDPHSLYALLTKNVDVPTFEKLRKLDIPWIYFRSHPVRVYPDGAVAGNILGFVSSAGKAQAGLEDSYDSCLAGIDGEEHYQRSAGGVPLPGSTVVDKKPKKGGELVTTLNADLQWFAQQRLAQVVPELHAQFGMVTVADAKTGAVKVAAQYPSVDPNDVGATDPDYRGALMFSTPYEPGSTFKSLTAAALIDKGLATPTTHVLAPYRFQSGHGADLHDAGFHPPEKLTLTGVLMESSNTGMSILGARMNDQERYEYLKKFGIGAKTAVDFPGQSSGLLHPAKDWDDQTKYATMFGQGVSATQAQMVDAYQALANGGVRVPLKLVKGCREADGGMKKTPEGSKTRVVSKKTAETVMHMLETIPDEGEFSDKLKIPGYRVAAKTGTAQEPDGHGGYKQYFYVSVMGAVPVDHPRYVVSVNIGYPTTMTSSEAATPLFKTIMSQVIKTYRIKPSTTAPHDYPPFY